MSLIDEVRNVYSILIGKPDWKQEMKWEIFASMGSDTKMDI
jgi:hypothetical protein